MARVIITQEDKDRSRIVVPGKYLVEVSGYEETESKGDGSALYVYELKIYEGKEKGVVMRFQVSEKAVGMGDEFWTACGLDTSPGKSLDPADAKGKKIGCQVQRGEYNGRPQNKPVSFFSLGSSAPAATATAEVRK